MPTDPAGNRMVRPRSGTGPAMTKPTQPSPDRPPGRVTALAARYSPDEPRPLRGYLAALATYAGLVGAVGVAGWLRRRRPVPPIGPWDVALMAVGTHRLSRTLAKDAVTSPLRAPFTRYRGPSAPAELEEEVRGDGVRHAVGELLTCPFCLSQWVATGIVAGHLLAPNTTRAVTATLTAVAGADALQFGYARLQQSA